MAAVTITAANIIPGSDAQIRDGTAGATVTQAQVVYLDSATSTYKLADCDLSAAAADAVGLCVISTLSGQPIKVIISGSLGMGACLTAGTQYYLGATAGQIVPFSDLTSGNRVIQVGYATTTSNLVVRIVNTGVTL